MCKSIMKKWRKRRPLSDLKNATVYKLCTRVRKFLPHVPLPTGTGYSHAPTFVIEHKHAFPADAHSQFRWVGAPQPVQINTVPGGVHLAHPRGENAHRQEWTSERAKKVLHQGQVRLLLNVQIGCWVGLRRTLEILNTSCIVVR